MMERKSRQVLVFAGIGLALSLIFGSGVWVGRLTVPEGLTLEEVEEYYEEEKMRVARDGGDGPEHAGLPRLDTLQRYSRILRLKPEQRRAVYPLFADASRKIRVLPAKSFERLRVIEELHQKLREHLDEKQKELALEILETARRRERK